ncbi:hypothetical protein [Phyllobacterium zundukense]|uniref:Uncharacterized protein n=2 Tax=Phyllobacterium zundukense TaxID=1867719 RepID=A0ACD4CXN6_9HYPH|nr:hypothetical protein [Phyllobacterium zundukense]UXN58373.1 hypothetical protein N8E88_06130 [Phyllobacterium zundukense]UXN59247.1 hypothetical protein N8E88_12145 [Phyllobacterium zundukense]
MQFTDAVTVAGTRVMTASFVADARIARTGIQTYLGATRFVPNHTLARFMILSS